MMKNIIIQHLFSALFTNKHALMRYLNRYDGMNIFIYIYINIQIFDSIRTFESSFFEGNETHRHTAVYI